MALTVVPALLGFSLGAMAIVLAFPTSKMFEILSEGGREDSYYIDLSSKLVHFIILQTISLLLALTTPSGAFLPWDLLGTWSLLYAVLTGTMVAMSLYNVARMYNHPGAQKLISGSDRKQGD